MRVLPRFLLLASALVAPAVVGIACAELKGAPSDAGVGDAADDGSADADTAGETGFTIVHDRPDAGAFRSVWVGGPETVYVGGDNGVVLEKRPKDWAELVLGPGIDISGVWSAGPNEALAVGTTKNTNTGPIFRRDPEGRWIQIGTAPHGLRSVWGSGDMRYVGANDGIIYSGPAVQPLENGQQFEVSEKVAKTLFAPIVFSVGGNDAKRVMGAGDYASTMFFDGTWHQYEDPIDPTRSFRAIWGAPDAAGIDIFQGANYYGLWHFTGSSNPVSQLNEEKDEPQNVNRWIWGIWGPSGDKIVCVGDGGRIMTWDRKTNLTVKQPSPTNRNLYAIGGTSLDDLWIVGEGQLILHGHLSF